MKVWLALVLCLCSVVIQAAQRPELPRNFVDTTYDQPGGTTIFVKAGDDFQEALDSAEPGDMIILEAGATYSGPFVLPVKTGSEWIVIRSSAADDRLPAAGTRISPSYQQLLPKLISTTEPVISAASGAHHYRFIGIEVRPALPDEAGPDWQLKSLTTRFSADKDDSRIILGNLIILGLNETSIEQLPHHIIFDRCYIHGDPVSGTRRGIAMNSSYTAVIDSYFSDFKITGEDAQAIAGWNGSGPFKIENNYLEGSGENIMFGGGTPPIKNLVPADIEIRHNHFTKPLTWMIGRADFAGVPWTVKNLFELKNARRVLIDGNFFEHAWPHGQNGFAILFTVRNEDGAVPWAVVEDVTFTNNYLRRIGNGINILGQDDNPFPSSVTKRILIKNNLFADVGGQWGNGRLLQMLDGTNDVIFEDNTAFQTGSTVFADGRQHAGFIFSGNIALYNDAGIIGSGSGSGFPTLEKYFPDYTFKNNIIIGGVAEDYPSGNYFPALSYKTDVRQGLPLDFKDPAKSGRHSYDNIRAGVDLDLLCAASDIPEICQR